jgi:hypothetical protein
VLSIGKQIVSSGLTLRVNSLYKFKQIVSICLSSNIRVLRTLSPACVTSASNLFSWTTLWTYLLLGLACETRLIVWRRWAWRKRASCDAESLGASRLTVRKQRAWRRGVFCDGISLASSTHWVLRDPGAMIEVQDHEGVKLGRHGRHRIGNPCNKPCYQSERVFLDDARAD